MSPIIAIIDANISLLLTIIASPTGSDPMFHSLPPSWPIEVSPRNNAPRPTPNRRGPAKSSGLTETGGALVEDGAGENTTGKRTITGRMSGMAMSRTTSFRRVADLNSRLTRAMDKLLNPNHLSLLAPERELEPEKCSEGGAVIQKRDR